MEIEREREPGDVETKHSNNKNRDRIESQYLLYPELTRDTTANKNPAQNLSRTDTRKEPLGWQPSDESSNMLAICYREYEMIIS